jgi:glutamate-1-semialdehyde 2,1-aminomutase
LRAIFARRELPFAVAQLESMVDFAFRPGPAARNYDQRSEADAAAFAAYYHAMRTRGILLPPSPNELMFVSTEHSDRDIDTTLEAADASFEELTRKGIL